MIPRSSTTRVQYEQSKPEGTVGSVPRSTRLDGRTRGRGMEPHVTRAPSAANDENLDLDADKQAHGVRYHVTANGRKKVTSVKNRYTILTSH